MPDPSLTDIYNKLLEINSRLALLESSNEKIREVIATIIADMFLEVGGTNAVKQEQNRRESGN